MNELNDHEYSVLVDICSQICPFRHACMCSSVTEYLLYAKHCWESILYLEDNTEVLENLLHAHSNKIVILFILFLFSHWDIVLIKLKPVSNLP